MLNRKCRWFRSHLLLALVPIFGLLILHPSQAHAMHIAEGILPANWAAIWYVTAAVFVVIGIIKITRRAREIKGLISLLGIGL